MGWSSMSFPMSSYLPSSTMNAVFSNFASVMAQESGAPLPAGVWSFGGGVDVASVFHVPGSAHIGTLNVDSGLSVPGSAHIGALNVDSGLSIGGFAAKELIQSLYVSKYSTQVNCTLTFSTYLVGSLTPKFSDSTIIVDAQMGCKGICTAGNEAVRVNLCRAPNGTPIVLTTSNGDNGQMDCSPVATTTVQGLGGISFSYQEASPGSGTAIQYGLQFAAALASTSQAVAVTGRIRVQEWR